MYLKDYLEKNNNKKHLILDFDETLFQLILPWEKWEEPIKNELIALDKRIYENYLKGKINLSQLQNEYIVKFGEKVKALIIENCAAFETKELRAVVPNRKLISFIKEIKGYKMYIWSSNTKVAIKGVLKEYNLDKLFEKIITRSEVDLLKPYPEGFKKIYDTKIPKEMYLIIGDSINDKNAAKNAKIDFFCINYFKYI